MKFTRLIVSVLVVLLAMLPLAQGQSVTGQISGNVTDSTGGAVVGAVATLTHDLSKQTRTFTVDARGGYTFSNIVPGDYTLRIEMKGFRAYEQKGINLKPQERVALNDIVLAVGDVSTTVEVQANAVRVATDSSDRSISISQQQIMDTPTRGRNPLSLIMTLPGVQTLAANDGRGWSGGGIPAVNGGRTGQVILNLDGVASQDSGNLNPGYMSPSVDAIGEVNLLVSNYTAESGGRTGGQLTFTIKNGTSQFHGTAYYYLRHEMFNANEFFNNKNVNATTGLPVAKGKYRYQNPGGTIGGPLIIPGTNFNKSRTKLFFFFSYDRLRNKAVINNTFTMPSAAMRAGDFSAASGNLNPNGSTTTIFNPTNQQPFAGNLIPQSQISAAGQAMLNLFPLPDPLGFGLDSTGARGYNYRAILPQSRPNEGKVLRIDYTVSPKMTTFVRLLNDYQAVDGYAGTVGPAGGSWGQFPHSYHVQAAGAVATAVYTFSPTVINEFTWGANRGKQGVNPIDQVGSSAVGGTKTYADNLLPLKGTNGQPITLPRIYSASNILNLMPQVRFGFPDTFSAQTSVGSIHGNFPNFGHDSRWPFVGTDLVQSINDKVTWVKGSHNVKAGIYIERMARNVSVYSAHNTSGSYYFGADRASALDAGYPFANAMVGTVFGYGDDNKKQINHARYTQVEWFVQDTWKATRRLTLDLGLRFHRVGDLYSKGGTLGLFRASEYDRSKSGQLLFPTLINGNRFAINPQNLATFPWVRQGTFDASTFSATGIPYSGIHQYDSHFFNVPPIRLGPRLGFALDVFGNGKTAMRGGFGINVGRNWTVDNIGATGAGTGPLAAPPNFLAPTILYTSIANLQGAPSVLTPQNVLGGSQDEQTQTTYNWSFGIQQEVGHGMVFDVSYVANSLKHGYGQTLDANAIRPLTTWTPTGGLNTNFRDPVSGNLYSTNLIRAMIGYAGYGNIPMWTYRGTSNYNSLQVQLNRRTGKLQWSANYTFSKTIIYNLSQWLPDELGKNVVNRPHAMNFNFGYEIPGVSRFLGASFLRHVTDGWRANGNGAIFGGEPLTVGCSITGAPTGYFTGTPTTQGIPTRCEMLGDATFLPAGQFPSATQDTRLQYGLNAANFRLPAINSLGIGNTPPTLFYGPGAFNLDLSLAKAFQVAEGKNLEFRVESFNTLNHFNPSNPNTSLSLPYNTAFTNNSGVNTNNNFGVISGRQVDSRKMIMSLRFKF